MLKRVLTVNAQESLDLPVYLESVSELVYKKIVSDKYSREPRPPVHSAQRSFFYCLVYLGPASCFVSQFLPTPNHGYTGESITNTKISKNNQ
jgi:hypothetical protein